MRRPVIAVSAPAATTVLLLLVPSSSPSVVTLSPSEFHSFIWNGAFDAVIDVRTLSEWSTGHLPNATFLDSLADFGSPSEKSTPEELRGCENCTLALYCRSGNRAGRAALRLIEEAGFNGPIYNGGGVLGWSDAGYRLVTSGESAEPPCACGICGEGQCGEMGQDGAVGTVEFLENSDGENGGGVANKEDVSSNGGDASSDEFKYNISKREEESTNDSGDESEQKEMDVTASGPSSSEDEEGQSPPFDEIDALDVRSAAHIWCPSSTALLRTAIVATTALASCLLA